MAKIRYTITTTTIRCPYCGYILGQESEGHFAPIIACLWIFALPALIPYWVIKHWAFGNPVMPEVGPKTANCPQCSQLVRTGSLSVEDLQPEEFITYHFKPWIYVSYVLGAILGFTLFPLLLDGDSIISVRGFIALIAFLGILAITLSYRNKMANCKTPKQEIAFGYNDSPNEQINNEPNEMSDYFYCRKCGNRLPADSHFCDKCGSATLR